jgi:hypothetical protein
MKPKDKDDDKGALEEILFGDGMPKARDLADPRNRRKVAKMARMMGIEVKKEQLIRLGIVAAIVLIVLAIGLWAIAQFLGLIFWAVIAVAIVAVVVMVAKGKPEKPPEQITRREQRVIEKQDKEADRKADEALNELERRLKG